MGNQITRNYEKENTLLLQQVNQLTADKVMISAMLDDALAELNQLKNTDNQEVTE
ncbi:hypothetical protein [Macrococcus sp. DPC7161]|uniref:hypothetical protein n=1 Tax=Macrococcus sp. DPC7161 TaxID=2507060 RepID=UPI0013E96CE2|nr:hypothetical protein [Macrococcus sp. DPC7161]